MHGYLEEPGGGEVDDAGSNHHWYLLYNTSFNNEPVFAKIFEPYAECSAQKKRRKLDTSVRIEKKPRPPQKNLMTILVAR